jgi:hypothetical protein
MRMVWQQEEGLLDLDGDDEQLGRCVAERSTSSRIVCQAASGL